VNSLGRGLVSETLGRAARCVACAQAGSCPKRRSDDVPWQRAVWDATSAQGLYRIQRSCQLGRSAVAGKWGGSTADSVEVYGLGFRV
jgi:hypothetical protein